MTNKSDDVERFIAGSPKLRELHKQNMDSTNTLNNALAKMTQAASDAANVLEESLEQVKEDGQHN